MDPLPPARPGTVLRILATNDMGAAYVAVPTSWGRSGTCAGVAELLERESAQQPTVWLDAGDLTVGAARALVGERRWDDIARLPRRDRRARRDGRAAGARGRRPVVGVVRMPAGTSIGPGPPETVALVSWVAPRLAAWLDRDLDPEPAGTGAPDALLRALR